jgi:tetratricopeptide (TPR) repeat protein
LEEVDESVQMIETRFQLELQTNPGPSAYNGRGKHHLQVHQFIKAIDDFSQAIVLDAESVEAYENRADAYVGLKLPLLARKDFKDACRLYAAQGKETDRLRVLDKSSELGAVSTVGMREGMTGAAFFFAPKKLDNLTDMELKRINTNLGNNIRTANMFRRKAEILYGQSQFGEAILACDEAIKANGDDGSAYRVRAEIETQQLKLEDALSDFDKAISLNERDETALRGRAMLYFFVLKDNEAALKDCTQGMSFSQNRQLQLLRGKIFIALDRCELAISDLTEFIDAWERFVNLWDALWLPVFKSIADGLRVELVDAYEQRAAAYDRLGQLDKSAEDLARAAHLKKLTKGKRAK